MASNRIRAKWNDRQAVYDVDNYRSGLVIGTVTRLNGTVMVIVDSGHAWFVADPDKLEAMPQVYLGENSKTHCGRCGQNLELCVCQGSKYGQRLDNSP